jgi:hypothetical protein
VPAPKKPTAEETIEELQQRLAAAEARLQQEHPEEPGSKLERILEMLVENQAAAQAPRETSLASMAGATPGSIMSEADSQLVPLPASEEPLPFEKVYRSKGKNLTIIYNARRAMSDAEGNTWFKSGQHIMFAPYGEFRTDNPDVVAFLESRDSFNREFWDIENVPGGLPDPQVALERIVQLSIDLNLEGLNEMEVEERSGFNRREVMQQIKAAQTRLEVYRKQHPVPEPA